MLMNSPPEHNLDQQEIHLDSTAGLVTFRKHFEEQFREFKSASTVIEEDVTQLPIIKEGKDAYYRLLGCVTQAEVAVAATGVDQDLLLSMQTAYDDFLSAYLLVTTKAEAELEKQRAKRGSLADTFSARELRSDSLLTKKLLNDTDIREAIETNFSSPAGFEARLWRMIRQLEEPSKLDKVLRITHGSIFANVLRGETIEEIDKFLTLSGEQVRAALLEMQYEDGVQYDYRTYVLWMDLYQEMKLTIDPAQTLLFEELFAIYQIVVAEANREA